jgi:heat shock protein HslJ
MEGDATELSLVPERLVGVWPRESCGARMTGAELVGAFWKLTRLGENAVVVAEPARQPNLTLAADGRVAGFTGCNRMAGSYQVTGRSIAFGQMASTKMACLEAMEHEAAFAAALERARSYRIVGELLARFEVQAAPAP